jgi:tripartite-type tricarboxylate transporter receptor subunit TctC
MRTRLSLALIVVAVGITRVAFAQYPERPVTILVGYDTGSPGDQIARALAKAAIPYFPQSLKAPPSRHLPPGGTMRSLAA